MFRRTVCTELDKTVCVVKGISIRRNTDLKIITVGREGQAYCSFIYSLSSCGLQCVQASHYIVLVPCVTTDVVLALK